MEILKENRTLVIILVLLVIAYLLWNTEVVGGVRSKVMGQWNSMGTLGKVVAVLVIVGVAYYLYNRE